MVTLSPMDMPAEPPAVAGGGDRREIKRSKTAKNSEECS